MLRLRAPLTAALIAVAALPGAATAETVQPIPGGGPATCLRATGADGLAALAPPSEPGRTELLTATPTDVLPGPTIALGPLTQCAEAATAGGAAVVAGPIVTGHHGWIAAAVHDPGAPFGPPAMLGIATSPLDITVAVSSGGDATVAWIEQSDLAAPLRGRPDAHPLRSRLRVAQRPAGGAFGPARTLSSWTADYASESTGTVVAAYDAAGAPTLAWIQNGGRDGPALDPVQAASGVPGGPLGAPQGLAAGATQGVGELGLAVSPESGALVAFTADGAVGVSERAPGKGSFVSLGPVAGVAPESGPGDRATDGAPAVALRDGGTALVAWRGTTLGGGREIDDEVHAIVRTGRGAFGPPQMLDAGAGHPDFSSTGAESFVPGYDPHDPTENDDLGLKAALADDGRFVLAWRRDIYGATARVRAATRRPDGSVQLRELGSPCRPPAGVAAVLRADGPAVAFADDAVARVSIDGPPFHGGRLHTLSADELLTVPAAAPAPKVHAILEATQRLRYGQRLRIPVACDSACDVRVEVPAPRTHGGVLDKAADADGITAQAGYATWVTLDPGTGTLVDPRLHGVPMHFTACSPDGTSTTTTSVIQPARQVPPRTGPMPLDVRARRVGGRIIVTWRIARPLRAVTYDVTGLNRGLNGLTDVIATTVPGRNHARFSATLRPKRPGLVTLVSVDSRTVEPPFRGGGATALVVRPGR